MYKKYYVPVRSPFSLIQEDLWSPSCDSEWQILISCMLLNCTTRKQVEKVLPEFLKRWPNPSTLLRAELDDIKFVCQSLGFANKRSLLICKMSYAYLNSDWTHASELPGVGQYASRAWEIFCKGILGSEPPNDHALTNYWNWAKTNEKIEKYYDKN